MRLVICEADEVFSTSNGLCTHLPTQVGMNQLIDCDGACPPRKTHRNQHHLPHCSRSVQPVHLKPVVADSARSDDHSVDATASLCSQLELTCKNLQDLCKSCKIEQDLANCKNRALESCKLLVCKTRCVQDCIFLSRILQ